MGCSTSRESIENQMMKLKLVRMEIQMERENNVNKSTEIDGHKIVYRSIPDYIDPQFAIENKIYYDTRIKSIEKSQQEINEQINGPKKVIKPINLKNKLNAKNKKKK